MVFLPHSQQTDKGNLQTSQSHDYINMVDIYDVLIHSEDEGGDENGCDADELGAAVTEFAGRAIPEASSGITGRCSVELGAGAVFRSTG
jgi:hypothetical protein